MKGGGRDIYPPSPQLNPGDNGQHLSPSVIPCRSGGFKLFFLPYRSPRRDKSGYSRKLVIAEFQSFSEQRCLGMRYLAVCLIYRGGTFNRQTRRRPEIRLRVPIWSD